MRPAPAEPLLFYVLGLVLLPLAAGLVGLGQQYLSVQIGQGVLSDLRNRLFRHLQSQSLRFFTTTRAGEITSRVSDDVAEIRWAISDTLPEILSNLIVVVGTLAVLFWVSWPLALAACATVPVFLLPARRVGRWRRKLSEETQEQHAQMLALLQDVLNVGGYVLMRLFNRTDEEARRFAEHNAELLRLRLKLAMTGPRHDDLHDAVRRGRPGRRLLVRRRAGHPGPAEHRRRRRLRGLPDGPVPAGDAAGRRLHQRPGGDGRLPAHRRLAGPDAGGARRARRGRPRPGARRDPASTT